MKSFSGKVAAITGAGSGIGRALSVRLADKNCALALSDIDPEGLAATVRLVAEKGIKITSRRLDVSDKDGVYAWADEVVKDHGVCNLIFNNAGISYGSTVEGADYADIERVMRINFWGVVYGTKAFLPHLHASGDGHVVNISSLFGLIGFPGQSAYNASKFAVRGFTECLREELDMTGAKVSATCVHPGGIKTNIARSSKTSESLRDLGIDPVASTAQFEKLFRTSPEEAARVILQGVSDDARRVLIGADARFSEGLQRVFPGGYQRFLVTLAKRVLQRGGSP